MINFAFCGNLNLGNNNFIKNKTKYKVNNNERAFMLLHYILYCLVEVGFQIELKFHFQI